MLIKIEIKNGTTKIEIEAPDGEIYEVTSEPIKIAAPNKETKTETKIETKTPGKRPKCFDLAPDHDHEVCRERWRKAAKAKFEKNKPSQTGLEPSHEPQAEPTPKPKENKAKFSATTAPEESAGPRWLTCQGCGYAYEWGAKRLEPRCPRCQSFDYKEIAEVNVSTVDDEQGFEEPSLDELDF